jgi:hypothetical protein
MCAAAWAVLPMTFVREIDAGWGGSGTGLHSRADIIFDCRDGVIGFSLNREVVDKSTFIGTDAPNGISFGIRPLIPRLKDIREFAIGFEATRKHIVMRSGYEAVSRLRLPLWCVLLPVTVWAYLCAGRNEQHHGAFEVGKPK